MQIVRFVVTVALVASLALETYLSDWPWAIMSLYNFVRSKFYRRGDCVSFEDALLLSVLHFLTVVSGPLAIYTASHVALAASRILWIPMASLTDVFKQTACNLWTIATTRSC